MEETKNIEYNNVPDKILKLSEDVIKFIPSIMETDFYTVEVIQSMLKNNKLIWSEKYYNGSTTIYNKGLVEFDNNILFYFIKKKTKTHTNFIVYQKKSQQTV